MSTAAPEQREARRIIFKSSAVIRYQQGQTMEAQVDTANISLNGLYLKTETRIPIETSCVIEIHLTGPTSKMDFKAKGLICRHDQSGMGITFTHLDPDSTLHIVNLVNLHTAAD
ncbi:MAG: PilZ domain-containing protein [Desulfobulbaceae bacterium]|jgi:hypothetical protein|nr:PilZ domain-containing protein [Desulfobulbaceae bacterium]